VGLFLEQWEYFQERYPETTIKGRSETAGEVYGEMDGRGQEGMQSGSLVSGEIG